MIFVRLNGGLGNQLFQYSLGRHLAIKNGTGLALDLSAFASDKLREYSLGELHVQARAATSEEINSFKQGLFTKLLNSIRPYNKKTYIEEKSFVFDQNVLEASSNVFLTGYWQSEKYFIDSREEICRDISLKAAATPNYERMLEQIQKSNSISLHVRRADYLAPKNQNVYANCSPEYYAQAVERISAGLQEATIFVFSDDIAWARDNISFPFPTVFVSDGSFANYEELLLMSNCKHNITANSSYSWWGAWLNANPNKIVVTPRKWFADKDKDEKDLIPPPWIQM